MIKNIVILVFGLSFIALIHEFGHLVVAKAFGVFCSEFSIGMGPKIWGKKIGETNYNIRALPLGGYVAMAGDDNNDEEDTVKLNVPYERTLTALHPFKKILVMYAGIVMNFVLAIFIIGIILLNSGTYGISGKPKVVELMEGYPAYNSDLKQGDIIEYIEFENGSNISVSNYTEMSAFLDMYDGVGSWNFVVNRNGEKISIDINPKYIEEENRYVMGATFDSYQYVEVNIFNCFKYSCDYLWTITKLTVNAILELFKGIGMQNLSGPVGMYSAVSEVSTMGNEYLWILLATLSLNVGVMNALPIPVMDGGRVFITLIEWILGKDLDKKVENFLMIASMTLLLMLFIFITYQDILKLF